MSIINSIEAEFVAQYYDLKLFSELGVKMNLDDFTSYELEAFRCISQGIAKANKEELAKARKGKK